MAVTGRQCFVGCGIALIVGALLGFVITYIVMTHGDEWVDKSVHRESYSLTREADETISQKLMDEFDAERIREHLR